MVSYIEPFLKNVYINLTSDFFVVVFKLMKLNLKNEDFHGSWENVTGHNSPLYKHSFDKDKTLNMVFGYLYLGFCCCLSFFFLN